MENKVELLIWFEPDGFLDFSKPSLINILTGEVKRFKILLSEFDPSSELKPPYFFSTFKGERWVYKATELLCFLRAMEPNENAVGLVDLIKKAIMNKGFKVVETTKNYHTSLYTFEVNLEKL